MYIADARGSDLSVYGMYIFIIEYIHTVPQGVKSIHPLKKSNPFC